MSVPGIPRGTKLAIVHDDGRRVPIVPVHPGWALLSDVRPRRKPGKPPKADHVAMAAAAPPLPIPDGDPLDGLTPNQRAIAGLVSEGRSHAEVAALLNLSPLTIKNAMVRVYARLGINAEAHIAAKRLSWLVGYWAGKRACGEGGES